MRLIPPPLAYFFLVGLNFAHVSDPLYFGCFQLYKTDKHTFCIMHRQMYQCKLRVFCYIVRSRLNNNIQHVQAKRARAEMLNYIIYQCVCIHINSKKIKIYCCVFKIFSIFQIQRKDLKDERKMVSFYQT